MSGVKEKISSIAEAGRHNDSNRIVETNNFCTFFIKILISPFAIIIGKFPLFAKNNHNFSIIALFFGYGKNPERIYEIALSPATVESFCYIFKNVFAAEFVCHACFFEQKVWLCMDSAYYNCNSFAVTRCFTLFKGTNSTCIKVNCVSHA